MAEAVYVLCSLTSLACALLLLRSWWRSKHRLLMWSAICFLGLMFNNALLVADKILFPSVDLTTVTPIPALVGLAVLAFGLILEAE
jgi:hypothetical protein